MTFTQIETKFYQYAGLQSSNITDSVLNVFISEALRKVVSRIMVNDYRWQYDDSNHSDLPIATTTITSGQQDYGLATSHLTIDRVEIKDSNGDWKALKQIDQQRLKGDRRIALAEYKSVNGRPEEYDVLGNSVFLYPTPDYTQAASLKLYFTREPLTFDYTVDTLSDGSGSASSEPGFNSLFHDLIPLYAAYDYALSRNKGNASLLFNEIQRLEMLLEDFYGLRNRDTRHRLTVSTDSNR